MQKYFFVISRPQSSTKASKTKILKQHIAIMKKLSTFIVALSLILGMAQCKKQETHATPQNTEGNLVHLTVKVGNGSKVDVDPSTGIVSFSDSDKLYVGYNNACVGTLEYSASTNKFSGDLSLLQNGDQPLHFYYLGGEVTHVGETQQYIVDIYEQQFNPYPVISYGTSTTNYSESSTTYSSTLENQCALVEFTTNMILKETNFYIQGINNQVAIDFENNTITTTNTTGNISLYPETPTSRWAILLPNEEPVTVNVYAVGYIEKNITIPPVKKNDYLHGENAVSFELTAMDADTPLTMMMMAPEGTICVINPPEGMQYEKFEYIGDNNYNSYGKQAIPSDEENNIFRIEVNQDDKVSFYGDGTSITDYSNTHIVSTNHTELHGNIMSLVDEYNFATATSMERASFAGLFSGDGFPGGTFIINASGLLLPATELVDRCYASMFYQCGTLQNVTCLATTINGTDCTTNWLYEVNNPGTFTKAKGASCWTTGPSGIPSGWTVNEY